MGLIGYSSPIVFIPSVGIHDAFVSGNRLIIVNGEEYVNLAVYLAESSM